MSFIFALSQISGHSMAIKIGRNVVSPLYVIVLKHNKIGNLAEIPLYFYTPLGV
jgi:hypothetical protein